MAGSSTSDWFKKWRRSMKKPKDTTDSTTKNSEPIAFDDPSLPPLKPLKPLPFNALERVYDMSGDKIMLVFGHSKYQESRRYRKYKKSQPEPRENTYKDVRRLQEVFEKGLGFNVEVYANKTSDDINGYVRELSQRDHSKTSCVCIVILTHGDSNGELMAADQPYKLDDLVNLLQHGNQWLVGKPKLFIVQACRGGKLDEGRLQLDGAEDFHFVSTHADTLIFRSSVEGYVSWNDDNGSWLIQELCRVVHATHKDLDFLQMTTMVTSLVVYDHESYTQDPATDYKKQTPETQSTLTKLLRFTADPKGESE